MEDIKRHGWFRTVDWERLASKELEPPFVPDVCFIPSSITQQCAKSRIFQSKKANFDATHELEELLLEDNPLKARRRNPNQDIRNLSTEYRQMEEQWVVLLDIFFTVADYRQVYLL